MSDKKSFPTLLMALVTLALVFGALLGNGCARSQLDDEKVRFYEAITDTLTTVTNENALNIARIKAIETQKTKAFTQLKSTTREVKALQHLVDKYAKKLKRKGSATIFKTQTVIDTVFQRVVVERTVPVFKEVHDTVFFMQPRSFDSQDDMQTYKINLGGYITGLAHVFPDSLKLMLNIENDYSVVIGQEGKLFRKKTYAEVTSDNPYTKTKTLRTYSVMGDAIKRFGFGPNIGFSLNGKGGLSPHIGVGIQYNLLTF